MKQGQDMAKIRNRGPKKKEELLEIKNKIAELKNSMEKLEHKIEELSPKN